MYLNQRTQVRKLEVIHSSGFSNEMILISDNYRRRMLISQNNFHFAVNSMINSQQSCDVFRVANFYFLDSRES